MLFLYAVPFSFAYTRLSAGTGALILFGAVQVTMLVSAARSGETLRPTQWLGVLIALAGLMYLVLPGLTAPPPSAAALMGIAGVSWGIYTLRGRGMANPLAQTTINFVRAIPLVIIISILAVQQIHVSPRGVLLAVVSRSDVRVGVHRWIGTAWPHRDTSRSFAIGGAGARDGRRRRLPDGTYFATTGRIRTPGHRRNCNDAGAVFGSSRLSQRRSSGGIDPCQPQHRVLRQIHVGACPFSTSCASSASLAVPT